MKERTEATISGRVVSSVRLTATDAYGKVHNGAIEIEFYGTGKIIQIFSAWLKFLFSFTDYLLLFWRNYKSFFEKDYNCEN